jgi:hypothetical protein
MVRGFPRAPSLRPKRSSRDLDHLILAGSWLMTTAPALLTTSSWESVPPEQPIARIITPDRSVECPSRRNNSIEREQIVEMHKLDAVFGGLCWAPESRACSRPLFRNQN